MDGPPESNAAGGKGPARYYGRFIPNLPLRGKLGWMTPRSRCENDAGYETRLLEAPDPKRGPHFFPHRRGLLPPSPLTAPLIPPHHPRLHQAKLIKSNHLLPRHLRNFLPKFHMHKGPERCRLDLDYLPLNLSTRNQPHPDQNSDRISSNPPYLETRIFFADRALPPTIKCATLRLISPSNVNSVLMISA